MNNQQYHQQVAKEIIDMLKAGTAPWQQSWASGDLPMNGNTRRRYRGMNALYLYKKMQDKGYKDSRWYTFKQINALGGKINKGEKGSPVEFWKFTEMRQDAKGEEHEVPLDHPVPFRHVVFNAEQATGLPEYKKESYQWEPVERAERMLQAVGTPIYHDQLDQNFYNSRTDSIHLTPKDSFRTEEGYYSTALHELGHSTGHSSRLDRPLANGFGTPDYAREELRAEIASFMLCKELGLEEDQKHREQHASYVGSWIEALEKDHNEIFRAAADAEKICTFIYDKEKLLEQELNKAKPLVREEATTFGKENQAPENFGQKLDKALQASKELSLIPAKVNEIVNKVENAFTKMGTILNGEKTTEPEATQKPQPQEKAQTPAQKQAQEKAAQQNKEEKQAEVVPPTAKQVYYLKCHKLEVPASKVMASVVIGREIKLDAIRRFEPPQGKLNSTDAYRSLAKEQLTKTKQVDDVAIAKELFNQGFSRNEIQRAIFNSSPANSHANALDSTKKAMEGLPKEKTLGKDKGLER